MEATVYMLRQNLTENQAILVFSGQKSGTRIILSILQALPEITPKTTSHGNRRK